MSDQYRPWRPERFMPEISPATTREWAKNFDAGITRQWEERWGALRRLCDDHLTTLKRTDLSKGERSIYEAAVRQIQKQLVRRDIARFHRRGGRALDLPLI